MNDIFLNSNNYQSKMKLPILILLVSFVFNGIGQTNETLQKTYKLIENKEGRIEALEILNKFIEKDTTNANAYWQRAKILSDKGYSFKRSAYKDAKYAIKLDSNNAEAQNTLGIIFCRNYEPEKALNHFNKAIELNPKSSNFYCNIGAAYYMLREKEKALNNFEKSLRLEENKYALDNRGLLFMDNKEYALAVKDFSAVLKIDQKYINTHFRRGFCYYHLLEYRKAISDFDVAIDLFNSNYVRDQHYLYTNSGLGQIYYYQSLCYEKLNLKKEAKNSKKLAIKNGKGKW